MTKFHEGDRVVLARTFKRTAAALAEQAGTVTGISLQGTPWVVWDRGVGHGAFPSHELRPLTTPEGA